MVSLSCCLYLSTHAGHSRRVPTHCAAGTGTPRLAEAAMPEEEITEGQQRQLDMITRNTAQQDQLVDKIGAGVGRLKEYALAIGEVKSKTSKQQAHPSVSSAKQRAQPNACSSPPQELDIQDRQLDDIHKDVDKTQKHLDRVNERANKALKMVSQLRCAGGPNKQTTKQTNNTVVTLLSFCCHTSR